MHIDMLQLLTWHWDHTTHELSNHGYVEINMAPLKLTFLWSFSEVKLPLIFQWTMVFIDMFELDDLFYSFQCCELYLLSMCDKQKWYQMHIWQTKRESNTCLKYMATIIV